jgi:hypothetical protein
MNGNIKTKPATIQIGVWTTTCFAVIPRIARRRAHNRTPSFRRCQSTRRPKVRGMLARLRH